MKKLWVMTVTVSVLFLVNCFLVAHCLASSLSVELIDFAGGGPGGTEITFNNNEVEVATESAPWVLPQQYLAIEFDCDYWDPGDPMAYWGLRVITDNLTDTVADLDNDGIPEDVPVGVDLGNGYYSYAGAHFVTLDGFNNITSVTDDSARKITLAWQIYNQNDAAVLAGIIAPTVHDNDGDDVYEDLNVSQVWYTGDWAYIGDKSDDNDYPDPGAVLWQDIYNNDVLNYSAVAYGQTHLIRYITPHPDDGNVVITDDDAVDEDGDGNVDDDGWDIYVFLAGRFWSTAYADNDGDGVVDATEYFRLPNGDYRTRLHVEIFHE